MKSYRKSLPPLDSLLFFNAVANNRSLNNAAEELFVTQAAVSKRIQRFEEWLGTPLFSRDGRMLADHRSRLQVWRRMSRSRSISLNAPSTRSKPRSRPVVRIAANAAVSMFWLYRATQGIFPERCTPAMSACRQLTAQPSFLSEDP